VPLESIDRVGGDWSGARRGLTPLVKILQEQSTKGNESFMTQPTKTIHFCPDEWMLLLEALHCYKDTNDGRKVAGRLNWIRSKLVECHGENCLIRLSA
jgi:hypothetical protein